VFATSPTLVTPALGTPSSGVVTNLTGTASININGTVGATTASTGAFTTLSASGATTLSAQLTASTGDGSYPIISKDTRAFSAGVTGPQLGFFGLDSTSTNNSLGAFRALAQSSQEGTLEARVLSSGSLATIGTFTSTGLGIGTSTITSGSGFTPRLVLSASDAALIVKGQNSQEASVGSSNSMYIDCIGATTGTNNNIVFRNTATNSNFTPAERMRIDTAGNVGIGTSSPVAKLDVQATTGTFRLASSTGTNAAYLYATNTGGDFYFGRDNSTGATFGTNSAYSAVLYSAGAYPMAFFTNGIERARIDSSGNLLVGTTSTDDSVMGFRVQVYNSGRYVSCSSDALAAAVFNRNTDDGNIVELRQAGTTEGTISVSGTTVSYNGGHLSRWAQTTTAKDESLVKGTVLSNLDAMNVYTDAEGNPVANEQLNKVKVSDIEGDVNVAGVFVNWTHDEQHNVDEINMAMTGDMIIRIAQGVTVVRGDLLMSAGDGTAKPQGDDIVRSKTVAKVTSNHITCTYADGSYCVPCVLMAC
jgi:hypothetical protein